MRRSEEGLFELLEKELKARKEPVDCVTLYNDNLEIRNLASSANRVSDYLGNMWRKGLLVRLPAPKGEGSKARWLYAWKGRAPAPKPDLAQAVAYDEQVQTILNKPNVSVEDDGKRLIINTRYLTITIEHKEED